MLTGKLNSEENVFLIECFYCFMHRGYPCRQIGEDLKATWKINQQKHEEEKIIQFADDWCICAPLIC